MEPDTQMSHDLSKVRQLVVHRARYLHIVFQDQLNIHIYLGVMLKLKEHPLVSLHDQ